MKVIKNKIFISLMSALCVIGLALGITFIFVDLSPDKEQIEAATATTYVRIEHYASTSLSNNTFSPSLIGGYARTSYYNSYGTPMGGTIATSYMVQETITYNTSYAFRVSAYPEYGYELETSKSNVPYSYTGSPLTTTVFSAYFKRVPVTVTLDKQGGTGGADTAILYLDGGPDSTFRVPTRSGYVFQGYFTQPNGQGNQITSSNGTPTFLDNLTFEQSVEKMERSYTLYAYWKQEITVTFNQQSGSGGTSSVVATPGSSMPSITVPSRTGYTFQGYYTGTNGSGTKYYNANGSTARSCDLSSDTTLYAYWIVNKYLVNINALHPDGSETNPDAPDGYGWAYFDIKIDDTAGTYSGTYTNWTNENNELCNLGVGYGSTITISNIRSFIEGQFVVGSVGGNPPMVVSGGGQHIYHVYENSIITIKMAWASHKLDVYLNGGKLNGSTGMVSYTQEFGTARTLPVPTREGYTFKGWRMTAASDGVLKNLGKQIAGTYSYSNDSFFMDGDNVGTYNNLYNGNVILTRESASLQQSPFNTHVLKISNVGEASPGLGGFTFLTNSYANAEFISIFEAKIPLGYTVNWATNQIGASGDWEQGQWLTSQQGTGDWETYALYVKCDSSGSFSSTNYFYLNGTTGTTENPVDWYLSQASVYDCTGMGLNTSTIMSNLSKETTYTYGTSDATIVAMWETDVWTRHVADSYAGGDGSVENPYQIANASQLAKLADDVFKGNLYTGIYFKQTANIDLSGHYWKSIGNKDNQFLGNYDGGYKVISDLNTTKDLQVNSGLFGYVQNSRICNIILRGGLVEGNHDSGAIVGANDTASSISNCIVDSVTVDKVPNNASAGGIAGRFTNGTISNCIVLNGTINSAATAGGICGWRGTIVDCAVIYTKINKGWTSNNEFSIGWAGVEGNSTIQSSYAIATCNGTATKIMYGGSSSWGNWTYNSSINNGYPVQSGLFWIGGESGSVNVYNYLKNTLGFTEV